MPAKQRKFQGQENMDIYDSKFNIINFHRYCIIGLYMFILHHRRHAMSGNQTSS